ncbi:single-strand binding protein [Parafrankia sp. EAN1pec]|uniref:single-stranded DNA-binding protein n=1 Tax=Parafrankia sp. (strain EAN1pec) TaxID=298653 RepID=UPI00005408F8|nr:single-strand binding protein [Frankia sp. EAN1pec]
MTGEPILTVIGQLASDPELRFTPNGAAVASFTIASTPRIYDKQANEWKDGQALFLRCSIWRQAAENVAESLTKGTRVIAQGRLKQRSFETKEGEKRTVIELEVDEIGPSLGTPPPRSRRPNAARAARMGAAASSRQARPAAAPAPAPVRVARSTTRGPSPRAATPTSRRSR